MDGSDSMGVIKTAVLILIIAAFLTLMLPLITRVNKTVFKFVTGITDSADKAEHNVMVRTFHNKYSSGTDIYKYLYNEEFSQVIEYVNRADTTPVKSYDVVNEANVLRRKFLTSNRWFTKIFIDDEDKISLVIYQN